MNREQLLHIIENPNATISADNLKELEALVKAFPYFQGGHILIARAYHLSGNVFADKKIKKAAVYAPNRKKLKNYISAPTEVTSTENKPVPEAPPITTPSIQRVEVKETESSLNEDIRLQLEKLQEVKKEVLEPIKEVEQPKEAKKEVLEPEKEVEKPQEVKKALKPKTETKKLPAKAKKSAKAKPALKEKKQVEKKAVAKPQTKTTKKESISSSRLGDALYEINDRTEEIPFDNTPDILLEYLQHIQSKKRPSKKPKKDQFDIIDSFIKEEPSISRIDLDKSIKSSNTDLSQNSSIENTKLISENLALIYARQGNISKAISIYEELILKNPLKKAYFASQIEKLKN